MQKLYFQDSFTLKNELDRQENPSKALRFICGSTSVYKNIQTGPSLHRIRRFSLENDKHMDLPHAVLMDALGLLMTNNIFQFGDPYCFHKVRTVIGAPPAPPWAAIFFGVHKGAVFI